MEIACGSLSGTASLDMYPGRAQLQLIGRKIRVEAHEF